MRHRYFRSVADRSELAEMAARCAKVLAVGTFDFSADSAAVVAGLAGYKPWFDDRRIGLALFNLGDGGQVVRVCPDFLPRYLGATREPALLVIEGGSLTQVRFGPADVLEIIDWIVPGAAEPLKLDIRPRRRLQPKPVGKPAPLTEPDPMWDQELDRGAGTWGV